MRIAISGYYGFGNAGDEAVLAGMLKAMRHASDITADDIAVLSGNPSSTASEHGVRAVPRAAMAQVKEAIRSADVLISGGGSLLQDVTSFRSLVYYLWVIRIAHRLRRPVAVYAQGIGPLRRPVSRWMVRRSLAGAAAISVRDEGSASTLRAIGLQRSDIRVTADPAFALDVPLDTQRTPVPNAGSKASSPTVGIAPRPWPGFDSERIAAATARGLSRRGITIALIPMQDPRDEALCAAAAGLSDGSAAHVICHGQYAGALAACSGVDVLIGMRLHALIMGAICGAAPVGVSYDPKVAALMGGLGFSDAVVELPDATPEHLAKAALDALGTLDERRTRLTAVVDTLRREAFANAGYILDRINRIGAVRSEGA